MKNNLGLNILHLELFRLTEAEHILVRTIHHIIFDGWSDRVFLRELGVLYDAFSSGKPSPLSELPVQYADWLPINSQPSPLRKTRISFIIIRGEDKSEKSVSTIPLAI